MGYPSKHYFGVQFAQGNSKVGDIASVSLLSKASCVPGCPCRKKCYACRDERQYKQTKAARKKNLKIYQETPVCYFEAVDSFLKQYKGKFFRWHVGGDVPTEYYFNNILAIAAKYPRIKFLLFTKRYGWALARAKIIPFNLSIILSAWPNYPMPEQTTFPVAYCRNPKEPDSRIPQSAIECPGNCDSCGMCWNLRKLGVDVVFEVH